MKKKILVVISKGIMRRNILETDFWPSFVAKNTGNDIVLLGEQDGIEEYKERFGGENITHYAVKKEKVGGWHRFVLFLVRTGTNAHGVKLYRWRGYELGEAGLLVTLLKSLISNTLGRVTLYKQLVRKLYSTLSLEWIDAIMEAEKPDMVFVPSLIDVNVDAIIGVAAKKRDIKTVGMVRSWDNLSIHGLLPFVPDVFIFQNKWLVESAEKFQGINTSKLPHSIIGLPHYDAYKNPEPFLKSREEFFAGMGLDPAKKLILLGGFDFYWSEDVLPANLDAAIERGAIDEPVQVVFRPHPGTPFQMEEYGMEKLKHTKLNAAFLDTKTAFSDRDTFINLVYHCDVLINVASTLAIDGAVFDRPVICIDFDDPAKNISKWKSVHRLFDSFDHYEKLVATGGVKLPRSFDEMIADTNAYLADPSLDREGRQRIIDVLVAPFEGDSGKRLVSAVQKEVDTL